MPYSPTTWANGVSGGTPLSAANLNNIEAGIVAVDAFMTAHYVDPVTSLPGSPADKQRAILVDSLTAPTYAWLFQYESGISDANKWLFIGGSPQASSSSTDATYASSSYVDSSVVTSLTVARAGVYHVRFGATLDSDAATAFQAHVAPKFGAAATDDANAAHARHNTGQMRVSAGRELFAVTLAASDVVKLQFRADTANSRNVYDRFLAITPLRVA